MSTHSSGCYVIDSDYNVVNVNETGRALYPQLRIGEKCHACLMGLDHPCPPCPVANGTKGPRTYTDPIRHISEIVDAVDIDIEGKGLCHMLVFSTVENEEAFAATLPTSEDALRNLALIKALTEHYYDVFSLSLETGEITLYRHKGEPLDPDSSFRQTPYEQSMANYIEKFVFYEDQERLAQQCSLSNIREILKTTESVTFHYRVFWHKEIHHYYRKIVRIGDPDNFGHVVVGIACEDDEIRKQEERIALEKNLRKVEYSALTGLLTREAFFIYGNRLLESHPETDFDFCILRIENLSSINHQYGRISGEKTLQLVGETLKAYERETSCIAYLGDSTFACLVESLSPDATDATISAFQNQLLSQSDIKNITCRWFFYKHIHRDASVEELYDKFFYVLSTIRPNPHQHLYVFDQSTLASLDWDASVVNTFRKALADGEFVAWYQPKYSVYTQKVAGAEALVRWQLPSGKMIPPDKFIPVLENSGLINLLDKEIFRQACVTQRELMDQGITPVPISVNLSRASIFTKDIAKEYSEIANSLGVDPKMVPIEITESAAVRAERIREFADSLIQKGFLMHMDDFGAGYSSLASLQSIPFECIKLDKSLIDFIGNQGGESLLKHTISFAKENGMTVIAEGVETMEQFMFLKVAGCDYIQGYYFSKPLPKADFLKTLR